jgi:hypothetical protein
LSILDRLVEHLRNLRICGLETCFAVCDFSAWRICDSVPIMGPRICGLKGRYACPPMLVCTLKCVGCRAAPILPTVPRKCSLRYCSQLAQESTKLHQTNKAEMDLFLPKVCKNSFEFFGKSWSLYGGYVIFLFNIIAVPVPDPNKIKPIFSINNKRKIYELVCQKIK